MMDEIIYLLEEADISVKKYPNFKIYKTNVHGIYVTRLHMLTGEDLADEKSWFVFGKCATKILGVVSKHDWLEVGDKTILDNLLSRFKSLGLEPQSLEHKSLHIRK